MEMAKIVLCQSKIFTKWVKEQSSVVKSMFYQSPKFFWTSPISIFCYFGAMEAQGIIEHECFSMEIVIINLVRSKNIWTRQNILILAQIYFGPVEGQSNTRLRPPLIRANSL